MRFVPADGVVVDYDYNADVFTVEVDFVPGKAVLRPSRDAVLYMAFARLMEEHEE